MKLDPTCRHFHSVEKRSIRAAAIFIQPNERSAGRQNIPNADSCIPPCAVGVIPT